MIYATVSINVVPDVVTRMYRRRDKRRQSTLNYKFLQNLAVERRWSRLLITSMDTFSRLRHASHTTKPTHGQPGQSSHITKVVVDKHIVLPLLIFFHSIPQGQPGQSNPNKIVVDKHIVLLSSIFFFVFYTIYAKNHQKFSVHF